MQAWNQESIDMTWALKYYAMLWGISYKICLTDGMAFYFLLHVELKYVICNTFFILNYVFLRHMADSQSYKTIYLKVSSYNNNICFADL